MATIIGEHRAVAAKLAKEFNLPVSTKKFCIRWDGNVLSIESEHWVGKETAAAIIASAEAEKTANG